MSTTTPEHTVSLERASEVATTIRDQIGTLALMTVGASNLMTTRQGRGGLTFQARILPFLDDKGTRGVRPAFMRITITLNAWDLYDIEVMHSRRRLDDLVEHYRATDLAAEQLPRLMVALDWDGPTPINTRYL